jgi:hypothetical protein
VSLTASEANGCRPSFAATFTVTSATV